MTAYTRISGVLNPGICLGGGEYKITKLLGQGGFGITYQGVDTKLNRPVAIKEFFPEGCWRKGTKVISAGRWNAGNYFNAKQQFLLEGQTLGQFNHPGIVRVFYYFEENNTAYLVMEYLQGKTLAELLKLKKGKLSESEALFYIDKVGQALATLHQAHFLHRDIKPDNIMLADDGRIVLIDFGAARDFQTDNTERFTTTLTPGYAPLEQYGQSLKYGSFTDIYGLGATLYHLLTGQVPVSAVERAAGVKLQPVRELEPRVSLYVSQAIEQAMMMQIEERIQSIAEFLDLLRVDPPKLPQSMNYSWFYRRCADPWNAFGESAGQQHNKNYRSQSKEWF